MDNPKLSAGATALALRIREETVIAVLQEEAERQKSVPKGD